MLALQNNAIVGHVLPALRRNLNPARRERNRICKLMMRGELQGLAPLMRHRFYPQHIAVECGVSRLVGVSAGSSQHKSVLLCVQLQAAVGRQCQCTRA